MSQHHRTPSDGLTHPARERARHARALAGAAALAFSASCIAPAADETAAPAPTAQAVDQAINGASSPASQFQLDRAVKIPGCTATRISARYAVTALHCGSQVGHTVYFYTSGPGFNSQRAARVEEVIIRPGASMQACRQDEDCDDSSGRFADIALLRLSTSTSGGTDALDGAHATLAWRYPGEDVSGKKVGAGGHNGNSNPSGILLQATDTLDSTGDSDGKFETTTDQTDGGDSGGPFYYGGRVLGTLWGSGWDPLDGYWNRYTSVPAHLDWILSRIGYSWVGLPPQSNTRYTGSLVEAFVGKERECRYACEKTTSCDAYNYHSTLQMCELQGGVTGASTNSGWSGALRFGASSGASNQVVGYLRGDGYSSVLHEATSGAVHELYLTSTGWRVGAISAAGAPAVAGRLSPYRRADGIQAVVYRSTAGRLIELALVGGSWTWADLSSWGGPTAAGDPVAYVRADGVSAVVYRSSTGRIHELRLGTLGWIATDLSGAAGVTVAASSDPHAFVRADGYSSVVFRAGADVWELYKATGGGWIAGVPSQLAGAPAAASRPFGYNHRDGITAIVYRSTANRIIELWIGSTGWRVGDITAGGPAAAGNPVAYVRTDGVESVVYRSTAGQIIELANAPWGAWNLSATTGAGAATTDPAVYVRGDGHNTVVHGIAGNRVAELAWRRGAPAWTAADLSSSAGETP
jgi:hypothetical protein